MMRCIWTAASFADLQKGEPTAMAEIKVPIQVNLPDDWTEQIVNRLRNDPQAEWLEIVKCKDCKWYNDREQTCNDLMGFGRYWKPDDFCSYGKRRTDDLQ